MARALYIHWPFCAAKCPYCDFNSHVREAIDDELWRAALLADLRHEADVSEGEPLASIFFGGGTPSLMPPALVADLISESEALFGLEPDVEITLEANPSSVEASRFADLAASGVNRVSLGLQSLENEALRFLGRLHDANEGLAALDVAMREFDRVSFDLIYALPEQTEAQWDEELRRALGFGTEHLSLYQLTIEAGTRFASDVRSGRFVPTDDDRAAALYDLTQLLTSDAGLPAYEISNHARHGSVSRHNLTYWRYEDYLGIGPGAHGRREGFATFRHRKPENFLGAVERNGHGLKEETALNRRDQAQESILMGLRLAEGLDPHALQKRFGLGDPIVDEARAEELETAGLLWSNGGRLGATAKGMLLLDSVLTEIIPDDLVEA